MLRMKIFVMGAGHMASWLAEELCIDNEVAVYDLNREKLKHLRGAKRFLDLPEVSAFEPELVVNAVSPHKTFDAFRDLLPFLPENCILSDIASVKTAFFDQYKSIGMRFVSSHPMFGPTFADRKDLRNENAIIIRESDEQGKDFFRKFYQDLGIRVYEYTFDEHDRRIAYSLSVPFASSMVFAACMKKQEAPGTTFRKHLDIARGLLSEDDHLLAEVMFNPYTIEQIEEISSRLRYLTHIIRARDYEEIEKFLNRLRENISQD